MANFDKLCSEHRREPEAGHRCKICARLRLERKIVRKVAQALIASGYSISVHDGEEVVIESSKKLNEILAVCFSVDEESFFTHAPAGVHPSGSFVFFVYGNDGYDVICDYGVSLEPVMRGVNEYIDRLEEGRA